MQETGVRTYRLNEAHIRECGVSLLELLAQVGPGLQALLATSLVEQSERRQPNREVLLADRLGQLVHQLQDEAATLLGGTAILIRPLVDVGAEELFRQVPIAAV